jgi:anti-sigma-K factor RskA
VTTTTRITRDDIEARLRQMAGDVDERVEAARPVLVASAVAVVAVVAVAGYFLGRRRGRRRAAVVEIRRL